MYTQLKLFVLFFVVFAAGYTSPLTTQLIWSLNSSYCFAETDPEIINACTTKLVTSVFTEDAIFDFDNGFVIQGHDQLIQVFNFFVSLTEWIRRTDFQPIVCYQSRSSPREPQKALVFIGKVNIIRGTMYSPYRNETGTYISQNNDIAQLIYVPNSGRAVGGKWLIERYFQTDSYTIQQDPNNIIDAAKPFEDMRFNLAECTTNVFN